MGQEGEETRDVHVAIVCSEDEQQQQQHKRVAGAGTEGNSVATAAAP